VQFSAPALEALKAYRWPGNVRELGNLIERLSIQCQSRAVGIPDLPARYRPDDWVAVSQPVCEAIVAAVPAMSVLGSAAEALSQASNLGPIDPAPLADDSADDAESVISPRLADVLLQEIPAGFDLRQYLETLEQRLIVVAMESSGGTVAQAARVLGLRRTTLVEKLRKYSMGGSEAAAES
jgi:sigma-54 specific flagellar transcriptional regulator A